MVWLRRSYLEFSLFFSPRDSLFWKMFDKFIAEKKISSARNVCALNIICIRVVTCRNLCQRGEKKKKFCLEGNQHSEKVVLIYKYLSQENWTTNWIQSQEINCLRWSKYSTHLKCLLHLFLMHFQVRVTSEDYAKLFNKWHI